MRRSTILENKPELLEKVVKKSHDKGKVYYINHYSLSVWNLSLIMRHISRCFPSQFNRSIRDTNLFFNETQICCSLIEIMRHVFFSGPKIFFSEIYRQFRFWGNIGQMSTTITLIHRRRSFCQKFWLHFCIFTALSHKLRVGCWFSRIQWIVDYFHRLLVFQEIV